MPAAGATRPTRRAWPASPPPWPSKGITRPRVPAGGSPYDAALDENQLSEAWADLGAGFGAGAGSDRMSFSLRSLTYPDLLPKAAQLAARQLGDPAFPEAVWQRERQRMAASLREAKTRPATVAGRAYAPAVYGNHPYGYEMTEAIAGPHRACRTCGRCTAA